MTELVQVEMAAPRVALLTLSDPERRNAITPAMNDQLVAAFDDLECNADVGAIVITGRGSSFCAGAELAHLGQFPNDEGLRSIYRGFLRLAASPLPTLAAVNGHAVGAGMNLALGADVRLAGRSARFDTRFLRLGIHPGGGHTWMMRELMGSQATMAAVLFGQNMDGLEAERRGLVWSCLPDEQLLEAALAMAAVAAAVPLELSLRTKATIAAMGEVGTHEAAVTSELAVQIWSMGQPEFVEGLAALQRSISSSG